MKTSSLYDVQKRAEAGGAVPRQPPPTRATRPCLCTLIVLSLLIVIALAVTLTLLLTGPSWLRLSYSGDSKFTQTVLKTGSLKSSKDKSPIADEANPETSKKTVTKASTTAPPPPLVIPTPTASPPPTKFWFKEVVFFKPKPVKTSSSETKTRVTSETKPLGDRSDKSAGESSPTPAPEVNQTVTTKSPSSDEKTYDAKKRKIFSVHHLFSGLWPFLSSVFPKTKTNQIGSDKHSEGADRTTPTPSLEGGPRASPAPSPGSEPTIRSSPEDLSTTAEPRTERAGHHVTEHHGLRVRRVPGWIFANGNAAAFAHGGSGARTSGGPGLSSGSYVRTYNRARNGVTRSWTARDETRNGVRTHTASDTGNVRLPTQRTSSGVHLVYDGASGTWRRASLPDASAAYTPPVVQPSDTWARSMPTRRPWVFRSPGATGAWGAFGNSQSASPYSGSGPAMDDPFAAARRRLAAARRRLQQYHQNMGGFPGYTNWG